MVVANHVKVTYDGDELSMHMLLDKKSVIELERFRPYNMFMKEQTCYQVSNNTTLSSPLISNIDAYMRYNIPKERAIH